MRIPKRVRDIVIEREDHCCIRCGQWAEGGSLHHRRLRSAGGKHTVENLVLIHGSGVTGCHGWCHANPLDALAEGLIVRGYHDPAERPVKVYGHGWVYLSADGRYVPAEAPVDPEGVAA